MIITSLKALDESFSSRNHVRKFLRALPTKWRPKVTAIEKSKDFSTLSLEELIGNLKVYEVVLEKDLEISKNKKEKYKSLALKAIKVLSEEEASSSDSNDKEYAMAVRDFKQFFRRRGKFVRQPHDNKKNFRKVKEDKKEKDDRRYFNPPPKSPPLEDDDVLECKVIENQEKDLEIKENEPLNKEIINIKESKDHPLETVIEVYLAQPPGFVNFNKPNHVFKLKKALYGVKQAPKAWYDRLKAFLLDHSYTMGLVDNTLFTKKKDSHIIIVQIYVDDIIFGSTCQDFCDDFSKIMHDEFEMSMMGELVFLDLQIKQLEDGIFFNQSKYIKEMLKNYGLEDAKPIKTHMSSETNLTRDKDEESVDDTKYRGMIGPGVETIGYADSNHAGDYVDRKSTSGVCIFMGCCLTSWFSKKQTALAISTTEAKYVSTTEADKKGEKGSETNIRKK
ncbi:retrovirus-related pol polyprotein from transposon TNT 1-94 [Tanacetum coccineum]|uniref:Retrovirus-related pol polyprotein from transposon TNT 1-94 n=1 Tax=Tanacetum coccineum TaxID=301880 RepID=A0ABQ5CTP5_9ASTR